MHVEGNTIVDIILGLAATGGIGIAIWAVKRNINQGERVAVLEAASISQKEAAAKVTIVSPSEFATLKEKVEGRDQMIEKVNEDLGSVKNKVDWIYEFLIKGRFRHDTAS